MNKRLYIAPVFVPHEGCPHDCAFCNQHVITGRQAPVSPKEIEKEIRRQLSYFPEGTPCELAFYGGSFTAIERERMMAYLSVGRQFIREGRVRAMRVSTRPDAVDAEKLQILYDYGVRTVELGAQSMADEVLRRNQRGHNAEDTVRASRLVREKGFKLGLQMMLFLDGWSEAKEIRTARALIALRPDFVRLYPTVVLSGTALAQRLETGAYKAVPLETQVKLTAAVYRLFRRAGVTVIRIGLQASEEIGTEGDAVLTPYHPAFGALVRDELYRQLIDRLLPVSLVGKVLTIYAPSDRLSYFVGMNGTNKNFIKQSRKPLRLSFQQGSEIAWSIDGEKTAFDLTRWDTELYHEEPYETQEHRNSGL